MTLHDSIQFMHGSSAHLRLKRRSRRTPRRIPETIKHCCRQSVGGVTWVRFPTYHSPLPIYKNALEALCLLRAGSPLSTFPTSLVPVTRSVFRAFYFILFPYQLLLILLVKESYLQHVPHPYYLSCCGPPRIHRGAGSATSPR